MPEQAKPTPGPWTIWGDDSDEGDIPFIEIGRGEVPSPECKSICDVRCTITDDDDITNAFILTEEDRANAALIAAAPETAAERARLKEANAELVAALQSLAAHHRQYVIGIGGTVFDPLPKHHPLRVAEDLAQHEARDPTPTRCYVHGDHDGERCPKCAKVLEGG